MAPHLKRAPAAGFLEFPGCHGAKASGQLEEEPMETARCA